MLLVILSTAR